MILGKYSTTKSLILIGAIFLSSTALINSSFAQDQTAGNRWPAAQRVSYDQIDHSNYDQMLQTYVDDNGLVNYRAWHANAEDRQALQTYLNELGKANASVASTKSGKLAYWINAYNALTIEGILRVYPTTSIRNHTPDSGYNIWKNLKLISGDELVSLNHIEHEILRKESEPRIHFAIVCASIGCPRLYNRAYTGEQLEEQLACIATDFFSRAQNLTVDGKTLRFSQIISWFGSDFGATQADQLRAVYNYLPEDAQAALSAGGYRVEFLEYDWNLNTQKN